MMQVSPRKAMAGAMSGGNFGVDGYTSTHGGPAAHVPPATGRMGELGDGSRGAKPGLGGGGGHAKQAAPDHGPMPDHHSRGGKI